MAGKHWKKRNGPLAKRHVNLLTAVKEYAAHYFGKPLEDIKADTRLDVLKHDSHDGIRFSFDFEDKFSVEIGDDVGRKLHTISDYRRILEQTAKVEDVKKEKQRLIRMKKYDQLILLLRAG
jgi:acyl carrier protein